MKRSTESRGVTLNGMRSKYGSGVMPDKCQRFRTAKKLGLERVQRRSAISAWIDQIPCATDYHARTAFIQAERTRAEVSVRRCSDLRMYRARDWTIQFASVGIPLAAAIDILPGDEQRDRVALATAFDLGHDDLACGSRTDASSHRAQPASRSNGANRGVAFDRERTSPDVELEAILNREPRADR
jgi:hypothetical protein